MKESDIRPQDILDEYIRLTKIDAETLFNKSQRDDINCPACGSAKKNEEFDKVGFKYSTCKNCFSLYQTPRPSKDVFDKFYCDSPSSSYWANVFFPTVAEARRSLLFAPKAMEILKLCKKRNTKIDTYIDVGAGHGILLEEFKKISPETSIMAIEPGKELAEICRKKGIEVLQSDAENSSAWHGKANLVSSFEVIEHVYDPLKFVSSLSDLVKSGGEIIITGLGVEGFDIQTLWENSKSVSPPHHLNFLSIEGFESIMERAGLIDIEIFTPGKLDVDIVYNFLKTDSASTISNRFLNTLYRRSDDTKKSFQEFLSVNNLSSHVWAIGKKK